LAGETTMLQATVARLGQLVPRDRVLIATNRNLAPAIARQLPELPQSALLGEPCKRDTAPCIGLAALLILRRDPEATMAVMPSDHVIGPDETFQQALRLAADLVDQEPQRIVTFGIKPSYAAESFGYIERGEPIAAPKSSAAAVAPVFRVNRFREKPKADVARQYVESGNFYWNSGIFVWRAATIADALADRQPEMFAHLQAIVAAGDQPDYLQVFEREFTAIQGISIDYAVMEHAQDVAVIEAPFRWDDVGSWQSIARLRGADGDGNTIVAKHLGLDTHGSIVRGPSDHLIVTLGLKDVIVVHTPDATLVANKHDEESIRKLTKLMEERGLREYL
jgi:mannose-1-phosphate guanylyltransferase